LRTVRTSSENLETATTSIQLSIPSQYVIYDSVTNKNHITLNVKRGAGSGNLIGLSIILEDEDGTTYSQTIDVQIDEFESKQISINESRITHGIKKITIIPIFLSDSGKETIGKTTFSAPVSSSSGGEEEEISYDELGDNILDYSTWTVGTSGSQPGFNAVGSPDYGNYIISGEGPFGELVTLWKSYNSDQNPKIGAGWITTSFTIDASQTYRYSVWMKRTGAQSASSFAYLGFSTTGVVQLNGNLPTDNGYFWYGSLPELDQWYLVVGFVHDKNYNGGQQGGVYDTSGNKVVSFDGGIVGKRDYKFIPSATTQVHKSLLYYDYGVNDFLYFYSPRVDVVNGAEPTINQLLKQEEVP